MNHVLEAWAEVLRQSAAIRALGQVECGYTTHRNGDCGYCGAKV